MPDHMRYAVAALAVLGSLGAACMAPLQTFEQKAQLLLAQADAYRELSSSLAHDEVEAAGSQR